MSALWLVGRFVDGQKRELLEHLWAHGACDAEHAIGLGGFGVRPSILRSLMSRKIVMQAPSGRYFVDPSRMHEAYGASNRFILGAMGAFLVVFFIIMLW